MAERITIVSAGRLGRVVVLTDDEGRRHALRPSAVVGISECDETGDSCLVTLTGGRMLYAPVTLDECLYWFA